MIIISKIDIVTITPDRWNKNRINIWDNLTNNVLYDPWIKIINNMYAPIRISIRTMSYDNII